LFITFEGIDGSGKSTQIARTADWLRSLGYDVLVSREPGGTPLGEAIRDILLDPHWKEMTGRAEFFLYSASRAQLVDELVRPHLSKPRAVVILDRYDDSSTAYQGGGREIGAAIIERINRVATAGLVPDITFVLDLDWPTSCARRAKTGQPDDRLESNAHDFFERVRTTYRELCAQDPQRMVLIDAAQDEDRVFIDLQTALKKRVLPKNDSSS
jgi:dTMP kinase